MQIVAIDIGFGFTKASDGKETVVFKSLYGDAPEIQFWMDFGERALTDYFHVTVDGKSYFVGDLAEQQSTSVSFTLDQERMMSDYARLFALTVTGLLLKKDPVVEEPIHIVSGLPVGFYRQYHDRFRDTLKGRHQVVFHSPDGGRVAKKIQVEQVQLLPQPMGSALNLLMNDNGQISEKELARQKIGVVDIGFRTTDYLVVDRLRYVERSSRTMDTGVSKAFNIIAGKLRENSGVNVELYRLYGAVESGTIRMRGQAFSFAKIRDQIFAHLAATIVGDLERLWANDWDLETILLTGGGAKEIGPHIQALLPGNVRVAANRGDARLANVQGYLKYGRHLWRNAPAETRPANAAAE